MVKFNIQLKPEQNEPIVFEEEKNVEQLQLILLMIQFWMRFSIRNLTSKFYTH